MARWFELLSQYEFKVEHRAGRSHSNADALSRRPCPIDCKHCNKAEEKYEPSCSAITTRAQSTVLNNLPDIDPHAPKLDIKYSQNQDPIIKTVIEWVKSKDYLIVKRVNDVIYKIRKTLKHKLIIVHHNLLKPYKGDNLPCFP